MTYDGPEYEYTGPDDEDPLILSPAMQQAIGPKAPVDLFSAVSVAMAALIEALGSVFKRILPRAGMTRD
ncbi:hypothetical protein [Streptomyces chartreusis]|uniref:hypothetical protein n=1 Tax=Streptomyces chartreusis TaxID=1969 RepID=UPI00369D939D